MEVNAFHREDFFLAQIAAEVCKGRVKDPRKVQVDRFLCKFKFAKKSPGQVTKGSESSWQESKRNWLRALGVRPLKNPKKGTK